MPAPSPAVWPVGRLYIAAVMGTKDQKKAKAGVASPAAAGPAGSHFEGQVGAQYLLTMLVGAEPRGLPGTLIDRVEFQRAAEGHPLDDVIVHAHDAHGQPAVLEVQVKRSITFAPGDPVFRDVVEQVAKVARQDDIWTSRHELAVATSKASWKIDGPYQDVLSWTRRLGSAAVFFERLGRKGSANDDMRAFVETFRAHLKHFDTPSDDETVWLLLRRFQILRFDYTAEGSESEYLANERAVRALHPDQARRAGALWTELIERAIRIASVGGETTPADLSAELKSLSFRLSGQRRFTTARAAIAENSRNALDDIRDRVGDTTLGRTERLAELRGSLDQGRYLEIRGDAGVGKSSLMRHLAEQVATEAGILVLAPGRTPLRGWGAMRAELGFDGSARELLSDMAGDGCAVIFIDSLDQFSPEERSTIVDLLRATAEVSGISVVTTARRTFGTEEPSWLPGNVLERFGRTNTVVIGELLDSEIEELKLAAPKLVGLLSNSHPARDVTRNLFRLSRLADQPKGEPAPRSEVDMALQWWETADGKKDDGHRDRSRLLRNVAKQALLGLQPLDVGAQPASAVDQLISSETFRDLGNDRVAFRHDVLREWGIANLLASEPGELEQLPVDSPAPAALARGIELRARIAIERSGDDTQWKNLLDRLSRNGVHGSWRRAVLMALVRSELASDILTRAAPHLLTDGASLLRELIRTTMAVDSAPAAQFLAALGADASQIPASLSIPTGPSWHRLIRWLLALGEKMPTAAIPDVVDLYTAWSSGMIGLDSLTPTLVERLYHWLTEIESSREGEFSERRQPFGSGVPYDRLRDLETALRTGFLLFCHRAPQLAVDYLTALKSRQHNDAVVESILKFRGSLAQAAPAALAELTATALIRKPRLEHRREYGAEGPFEFLDHQLLPESPAQGPFLDLLIHSPQHGLPLIRRLIDHAVAYHSGGKPHGTNAITVRLPDGERAFPWVNSYNWSRPASSNHYCVTAGLMALEAWAHRRIENGNEFGAVMKDVLGGPDAPAAYLLVAVDLVLSHWPACAEAAVPLLACPDLLALDRERQAHDNTPFPDIFGLAAMEREPAGAATLASIESRPSRRLSLDALIGRYAVTDMPELRAQLRRLLAEQACQLGEPDAKSDLRDPALMVRHALNLANPANWQDAKVRLHDGTEAVVKQYVAPEAEARHLAALQAKHAGRFADMGIEAQLGLAIDDPSKSSAEFARKGVSWARAQPIQPGSESDELDMRNHSIVIAAMIAMRDGDASLRSESRAWADEVFSSALTGKDDIAHRFRSGLRFNLPAIAFAGIVHGLKDGVGPGAIRTILEAAARSNPAAAHGLGASALALAAADERLPKSLLRCAFGAAVKRRRPDWDAPPDRAAKNAEAYRRRCEAAVEAETAWLAGQGEPAWPVFPMAAPRPRRGLKLPGAHDEARAPVRTPAYNPEEYVDHQAAALWLANCRPLFDTDNRPWLLDVMRAYADWTAEANGAALEKHQDLTKNPSEWNGAYLVLAAQCVPVMSPADVDRVVLDPIRSLPDQSFLDVTTTFLHSIDGVFFNEDRLSPGEAVRIRSALADRLTETREWRSIVGRPSSSIEMHLGPAAAAVFFNQHNFIQPARAYLTEKGIDKVSPFLPLLARLAHAAPCLFVAIVSLNLLEVSPRFEHSTLLLTTTKGCIAAFPDDKEFWIDHGIGRRVCALIEKTLIRDGSLLSQAQMPRKDVYSILAALVRVGVAEAARLETIISTERAR